MEPFPIVSERPVLESGPPATDYAQHLHDSIIIDNGATTLRAGWSSEAYPRIVMDNVGAKYRDRKTNRNVMLAGSEAYVDATSRAAVKSAFEGDIVCNFDQMVSSIHGRNEERELMRVRRNSSWTTSSTSLE